MNASRFIVFFGVLTLGTALFLTACNERNNVSGPRQIDFETAQFVMIDITDVENSIEDATIETDMTFNSVMLNYSVVGSDQPFSPGMPGMMGTMWFDRFDFAKHLGFILRQLNLTDDQKTAVRDLAKTFHDNMRPLVRQFYEANKTTIQEANAGRKAIADQVKAGTLTREAAAAKIKDLNQATRDKIKANPDSQAIKTAMCTAKGKFFAGIKGVLRGDQITKWDTWVARIKDPCVS